MAFKYSPPLLSGLWGFFLCFFFFSAWFFFSPVFVNKHFLEEQISQKYFVALFPLFSLGVNMDFVKGIFRTKCFGFGHQLFSPTTVVNFFSVSISRSIFLNRKTILIVSER